MSERSRLFHSIPFRLLFTTRVASNSANQMQAIVVGWQIYDLTNSAFELGIVGLVQFVPPLCMAIFAGHVVDRYDRRWVLRGCYITECLVSAGLALLALSGHPPVWPIFLLLMINGFARSFEGPCLQSLLPVMAPPNMLSSAVAAHASASKVSQLAGPTLGGILYVFGAASDYGVCTALVLCAGIAAWMLPPAPHEASSKEKVTLRSLTAGLRTILQTRILLATMSLDLVATLFGGVLALLPVFARDYLHIGAWGFGVMRSAPAVGALLVAAYCARRPMEQGASKVLFFGLTVYGAATFLFGVSTNLWLSLIAMFFVGAGDMLATVVRQTLIQTYTPAETKGRVYSVSSLCVNTGSQLGMFESGVTAAWFGAVGSVVLGGVAVLAAVAVWASLFPELRRLDRFERKAASA